MSDTFVPGVALIESAPETGNLAFTNNLATGTARDFQLRRAGFQRFRRVSSVRQIRPTPISVGDGCGSAGRRGNFTCARERAAPGATLLHQGADAATTKNSLADSTARIREALQSRRPLMCE